jgi:hypothetical protein
MAPAARVPEQRAAGADRSVRCRSLELQKPSEEFVHPANRLPALDFSLLRDYQMVCQHFDFEASD